MLDSIQMITMIITPTQRGDSLMSKKITTPETTTTIENVTDSTPTVTPTDTPEVTRRRRVTLNRVKSKFSQNDLKVTLVWDRTHFHFEFDGWENVSQDVNKVNVPRIGDLTEDQWVLEVKRVLEHVSK